MNCSNHQTLNLWFSFSNQLPKFDTVFIDFVFGYIFEYDLWQFYLE